jgi:signal transduction histidine kinase
VTAVAPPEEATTRIVRILAFAFGVGALVFGVLTLPTIQSQLGMFQLWWTVPTVVWTFGIPLTMAVIARWSSVSMLRLLAGVTAVGYLLAMLTLWPALIGGHLSTTPDAPWLLELNAIGTTAAALAWRPWAVWTYMFFIAILVFVNRFLSGGPNFAEVAAQDALYTLLYTSVFATVALITIRAGRALDLATQAARKEATVTATAQARRQERARMEALMHDSVLSTLLTAAHEGDQFAAAASLQARKTLAQLELFTESPEPPPFVKGQEFVWMQQATTTEISPEAYFSYDLDDPEAIIPGDVALAISEALAEALRNSLRHAELPTGRTARAVHVEVSTSGVRVVSLDDGNGFNPSLVPSTRLGIAVGISGRMARVDGGSARIESHVGSGTRVMLDWRRP